MTSRRMDVGGGSDRARAPAIQMAGADLNEYGRVLSVTFLLLRAGCTPDRKAD